MTRTSPAPAGESTAAQPDRAVVPVPPRLAHSVRERAAATGTTETDVWRTCAAVLARRLPTGGRDVAVHDAPTVHGTGQGVSFAVGTGTLTVDVVAVPLDVPPAATWARCAITVLTAVLEHPGTPADDVPLLDAAAAEHVLHRLTPHHPPQIRHRTLTGPVQEQIARTPHAPCLVTDDGAILTFREFGDRVHRLAHHLVALGAGPGTRIGICMDRSTDLVVAVHAATATGAAYVPLDPELPDARLAHLLADAAPDHVLIDPGVRDRVPAGRWAVLDATATAAWADRPTTPPSVDGTPAEALHLLYTSGTTGAPKGVVTRSDAAQANLDRMQDAFPYGPGDCAVLKTSPGFDVSIWELFWPLQHGARLLVCPPGAHRDPRALAAVLERHHVTMIFTVPTVLAPLVEHLSPTRATALRWVFSGGETLPPWLRDATQTALPHVTLINGFGPTEAGPVTDTVIPRGSTDPVVPVGRPAPNFRVAVLDERLRPVPVGVAGEAWISGTIGLGHGYWRAPGQTAHRFVADPYGPPGSRMYRTGDLCRQRTDGRLDHLGRIDRQIKIRGLRVEPGEIESVLAGDPTVADCAVLAHGDPPRLLAFVVPTVAALDNGAVAARAAELLPEHMRPDALVTVTAIPATTNGKTDEAALLRAVPARRAAVPPTDELETIIVTLYGRLLRVDPVGTNDTFVGLGGHSLLAFELLDELQQVFNATPDVVLLLTGTVGDVAAAIRSAQEDGR